MCKIDTFRAMPIPKMSTQNERIFSDIEKIVDNILEKSRDGEENIESGPPTSNGVKRHMVKAKNGAAICLLGAMRNTFFQKDIWTGRKTWVPYVFWRQGKNEFLEKDIWSGRKTWRPYVIWQWRKKKLLEIDIWSEQKTRAPYVIWQ